MASSITPKPLSTLNLNVQIYEPQRQGVGASGQTADQATGSNGLSVTQSNSNTDPNSSNSNSSTFQTQSGNARVDLNTKGNSVISLSGNDGTGSNTTSNKSLGSGADFLTSSSDGDKGVYYANLDNFSSSTSMASNSTSTSSIDSFSAEDDFYKGSYFANTIHITAQPQPKAEVPAVLPKPQPKPQPAPLTQGNNGKPSAQSANLSVSNNSLPGSAPGITSSPFGPNVAGGFPPGILDAQQLLSNSYLNALNTQAQAQMAKSKASQSLETYYSLANQLDQFAQAQSLVAPGELDSPSNSGTVSHQPSASPKPGLNPAGSADLALATSPFNTSIQLAPNPSNSQPNYPFGQPQPQSFPGAPQQPGGASTQKPGPQTSPTGSQAPTSNEIPPDLAELLKLLEQPTPQSTAPQGSAAGQPLQQTAQQKPQQALQQQAPQQGLPSPFAQPFTQPFPAVGRPPQAAPASKPEGSKPAASTAPIPSEAAPPAKVLKNLTIEELNQMIDKPNSLQERVDAMEEVGIRGSGTVETFELLKREALADTSHLSGLAQEDANYVRAAALWTAAMVNRSMYSGLATKELPLIKEVGEIVKNKAENPDVQEAAVQYLQVLNRPDDRLVKKYLKMAQKSTNQRVRDLAQDALAGKVISLPSAVESQPKAGNSSDNAQIPGQSGDELMKLLASLPVEMSPEAAQTKEKSTTSPKTATA